MVMINFEKDSVMLCVDEVLMLEISPSYTHNEVANAIATTIDRKIRSNLSDICFKA